MTDAFLRPGIRQARFPEDDRRRRGDIMPKTEISDEILEKVDANRRDFVRKVVVGSAFAAPIVTSISMDGLSTASAGVVFSGNIT